MNNKTNSPTPSARVTLPLLDRIDEVLSHLRGELLKACAKHAPMHSPHEGYAVILEELDELWDHVKADTGKTDAARTEALQIAAMGIRYVLDVAPMRVPCAACDRGNFQLGHADGCPNSNPDLPPAGIRALRTKCDTARMERMRANDLCVDDAGFLPDADAIGLQAMPRPLCRWWLRTRPTRRGIQLNNDGTPPCVEFYVPWWAWPLEMAHKASVRSALKSGKASAVKSSSAYPNKN